jgi:general secretion pathway protein B
VSYILDALRKSDLQRQHGTAPTLQSTRLNSRSGENPHGWIYGVLGMLLVSAGIGIGWLRPWQAPHEEPAAVMPTTITPPATAPSALVPADAVLIPDAPPAATNDRPRRAPASAATTRKEPAPRGARTSSPERAATSAGAHDGKVLSVSELPLAIQQEIPAMTIAVHAYSPRAADRMVSINNALLHEGATVQPGLQLDEITPDGMVFSYKGYRFRRGVQP